MFDDSELVIQHVKENKIFSPSDSAPCQTFSFLNLKIPFRLLGTTNCVKNQLSVPKTCELYL